MARHSSDAVEGYVEEALEEALASDCKLLDHFSLQEQISNLAERANGFERLRRSLSERVHSMAGKCSGGQIDEASVKILISAYLQPEIILNLQRTKCTVLRVMSLPSHR